jgi:ComF family protein
MTLTWFRQLGRAAEDLVYPPHCLICDTRLTTGSGTSSFCEPCFSGLDDDPNIVCPRCSSTIGPHTDSTSGCPGCRGQAFRFEGAVRLGPYDGSLREAILRAKTQFGESLAEELGRLLARKVQGTPTAAPADVVIPVPLHWRRRWARGYNQAAAVGHAVAEVLAVPCRPGCLVRVRDTAPQTSQSAAARRENVRGAFRARRVRGLRVLLVDDVMTTGATADAAAAALRDTGAAQVRVAVLARR